MTRAKRKIHKGDTVKVLSGKDRGRSGKVLSVLPSIGRAVVEGLNLHTKFIKARGQKQPGTRAQVSSGINIAKLQLIDPTISKPTRLGYKIEGGVKQRISKKSGQPI